MSEHPLGFLVETLERLVAEHLPPEPKTPASSAARRLLVPTPEQLGNILAALWPNLQRRDVYSRYAQMTRSIEIGVECSCGKVHEIKIHAEEMLNALPDERVSALIAKIVDSFNRRAPACFPIVER